MLTVYGVPFSQPVRAVLWVLLYKRLPFKLVLINVFGFDCNYLVFVLGIKFSATGAIFD